MKYQPESILRCPKEGRYIFLLILFGFILMSLPEIATATRCLVPELPRPHEPYALTKARLESAGLWQRTHDVNRVPPSDPQVGDTWLWYIWDLGGYPVATLKPCTVRGRGQYCYVVVDDDEWNVTIDQDDVDRIVQHFDRQSVGNFPDQGIWDLNTSHFGDPPNPLDNLERIFLLYYRFNISADGYFWYFDQYPDGTFAFASNEADVIYLATDSGEPASNYMLAVCAHEFEHLIHFNQDTNEDTWLDEGLGELAMWLFGNPDIISSFNSQPDNSLTDWGANWADYIQTYLWTLYVYEQYGGQPMIWDLIHNPANGMPSYQQTLTSLGYSVTMENIFGDWSIANFLDDTSIPDGQYGYTGDTLPPFYAFRTHNSYPAAGSGSVTNWATDYIRLADFTGTPTLDFNGIDSRDFRVAMMATDPMLPTLVRYVLLDEFNDGYLAFTDAQGYEEVVVAIANVYPSTGATYSYTVDAVVTDVRDTPQINISLHSHPNPFNPTTELNFSLAQKGHARLGIYDMRGRKVAQLADEELPAGMHQFSWDAKTLPSGHYLASLEVNGQFISRVKLALVK